MDLSKNLPASERGFYERTAAFRVMPHVLRILMLAGGIVQVSAWVLGVHRHTGLWYVVPRVLTVTLGIIAVCDLLACAVVNLWYSRSIRTACRDWYQDVIVHQYTAFGTMYLWQRTRERVAEEVAVEQSRAHEHAMRQREHDILTLWRRAKRRGLGQSALDGAVPWYEKYGLEAGLRFLEDVAEYRALVREARAFPEIGPAVAERVRELWKRGVDSEGIRRYFDIVRQRLTLVERGHALAVLDEVVAAFDAPHSDAMKHARAVIARAEARSARTELLMRKEVEIAEQPAHRHGELRHQLDALRAQLDAKPHEWRKACYALEQALHPSHAKR